MTTTPISLLDRLRQQTDSELWERLAELYQPMLHGWLGRYGLQASDRDDLVQEVLLVLVRELPVFRHSRQPGAFRAWLRTVLVHRLRDFWRSQQRQPRSSTEPELLGRIEQLADDSSQLSQLWDQEHDRHVTRHLLRAVQMEFSSTTWTAFQKVVLDGHEPKTVAAELGLSLNAVFLAKSRVLSRLRQEARGLIGG